MVDTIHIDCWQLWSKIRWWGTCQSSQTGSGQTLQTHLWLDGNRIHQHYIRLELHKPSGTFVNAKLRDKSIKTIPTHPQKHQYAPYPCIPIQYGTKKQYTLQESKAPLLDNKAKRFIQQVCGKFLFLGRAMDSTLLCPISAIASQSSKPAEDTMRNTFLLLDYISFLD